MVKSIGVMIAALLSLVLVLGAQANELSELRSQAAIAPAYNFRPLPSKAGRGIKVAVVGEGIDVPIRDIVGARLEAISVLKRDPSPINHTNIGAVGTEVISLIAALAPYADIVSLKALDPLGSGEFTDIANAVNQAAEEKAKIIVLTCSADEEDAGTAAAVKTCLKKGILIVVPAGNNGRPSGPNFPGNMNGVVAVGASDKDDQVAPFSNYSGKIIFAPGVDITAISLGGESESNTGSSFSAGVAGGIFAVLWSQRPGLTRQQLVSFVVNNAAAIEDPSGGEARRIDGQAALNAIRKAAVR